jgi:hypothetical protein
MSSRSFIIAVRVHKRKSVQMHWLIFRQLMLRDRALIFGCTTADLPTVFQLEHRPGRYRPSS